MRRVVVALACAVVAAVLPAPARAQAPTNGQLAVVQRDRNGQDSHREILP